MIFPSPTPEVVQLQDAMYYTIGMVSCQCITIASVVFFVNTMSFLWLFGVFYGMVGVYGLGFALDNSPLLGISCLFVCYILLYYVFEIEFVYHLYVVLFQFFLMLFAAIMKDKYSHDIYEKKPILMNIFTYIILGFLPYAIPFYVYRQNQYYRYWFGLQML